MLNALQIPAGQLKHIGPQRTRGQHHRVEVFGKLGQRDVGTDRYSATDGHAGSSDLADLAIDDCARQPERRDALVEHSPRRPVFLEHGYAVPGERQFACGREPRHAGADHRDPLSSYCKSRLENDRRTGTEVGGRAFGKADRHRLAIAFPAVSAGVLARPRAHPAKHRGKDVIAQVDLVGFRKPAVINRFEITGDVGARRTCRLARDVFFQPMQVLRRGAFTGSDGKGGGRFEVNSQARYSSGLVNSNALVKPRDRRLEPLVGRPLALTFAMPVSPFPKLCLC